jgi:hypothetical protein
MILDSAAVADRHPLRQEALAVSDAFEAVTNGMCDSETLARLDGVGGGSPLYPWVRLIRGIRAMYDGDSAGAVDHFGAIDRMSAPFYLAETLIRVFQSRGFSSTAGKAFADGLFRDNRVVRDAFIQLETCAESGLDLLLADTLVLLLKELMLRDTDLARDVFLWSMNKWAGYLLSSETLPGRIRSLFGRTEGLELLAEATREISPDRSLFYRLEVFEILIRESNPGSGILENFRKTIDGLWNDVERDFEVDDAYRNYYRERRETIEALISFQTDVPEPAAKTGKVSRFVQLDLFG